MTRKLFAALAATTMLTGAPVAAQELFDLGTILLAGGLTPIEEEEYGRAVSVVTAEDIEERGLTTVQDALRSLPGVSVNGQGSSFTQVRMRGGEANHTLILINGVEAAGGDGEYILSGLETANIDRIEVLRGPNSVFYGSNASSGVINIVTREGDLGEEGLFTIEGGGRNAASLFWSSRTDRGGVSVALSFADDPGWDFSGSEGERDGTRRGTAILSGDFLVTDDLRLGFNLRRAEEDYDTDGTNGSATSPAGYVVDNPASYAERDEFNGTVFAELSTFGGLATHRLSYALTYNDQSFNGGAVTTTDTAELAYRLSVALDGTPVANADHLLNVLIEQENDSSTASPANVRETLSYALEYQGRFDNGLNLQAGLRYDDNNSFENILVWNFAGSYRFGNGVRLHASAGTGAVNPSYFEITNNLFPAFPPFTLTGSQYFGNPNLRPERNRSFDIGVEIPIFNDRGTIDVTYFNETLTDEIETVFTGFNAVTGNNEFTFRNQAGDSTRQGVEVAGQMQVTDDLALRLAYTYLDARNPNGTREIRRPRHELALGATLDVWDGRGKLSADLRHVSGNLDTQFWGTSPTVPLPDYTVVNLSGVYEISDTVSLTGRIENLFDAEYSDSWGYAGRPLTATIGLQARF